MNIAAQLAEMRTQIATLASRRLADHPTYRDWLTNCVFSVDGISYRAGDFVAHDAVVIANAYGVTSVDPPLVLCDTAFCVPRDGICIVYAVTCRLPSVRVTLAIGGRSLFACQSSDLAVGQPVRATVIPGLLNHTLCADAPGVTVAPVTLHTLTRA